MGKSIMARTNFNKIEQRSEVYKLQYSLWICILCYCFFNGIALSFLPMHYHLLNSLGPASFSLSCPKFMLIILGGVIVAILLGESKHSVDSEALVANFYHHFVDRSCSTDISSRVEEEQSNDRSRITDVSAVIDRERKEEEYSDLNLGVDQITCGGDEVQVFMPIEELNKRVEEFIAKVHKQRQLEVQNLD